jgi:RNA polymerase sigma factor FliA
VGDGSQEQPFERSTQEVEALLASSGDLVARVLGHLQNTGIRSDRDELLAFGHQGLVEAAHRFDPALGDFQRFAYFRVRGSMIDGLRKMGNWSRRGYERVMLMRAANTASQDHADEMTDIEKISAAEADQRLKRHMAAMTTAMMAGMFADHTIAGDGEIVAIDNHQTAEDLVADKQMNQRVKEAIEDLPPPEDEIVRRFYVSGEKMDAIAAEMGKSKSWVSRMHTRALKRLGTRLRS